MRLVLASTSPYRRALLDRLGVPFVVTDPGIDEAGQSGESPEDMARRLARAKAAAPASRFPDSLVIGCDQVAASQGSIFGKPGSRDRAIRQLLTLSGAKAFFHTAVCVYNTADQRRKERVVTSRVTFRRLDQRMIERYLSREQAYDCAGSAKSEGLGIALIEKMESDDPTALVGLPLIALVDLLSEHGVNVI